MRTLFLVFSFLWVLPDPYQAFDIPLPNALLIRGEPVGFNTSSQREKRSTADNVTCSSHEYRPRKRNYCCNRCHPGFRVESDCSGDGQTTKCVPCESGTFMADSTNLRGCMACSSCLRQYGQIVVSECTADKDTQCGCPLGQFKKRSGDNFICQECTVCQNGTQRLECHDDKDTICECFHNFFFDYSDKSCHHCSDCQGPDCKDHCPQPMPVEQPNDTGVITFVLGVVMMTFIVAAGVFVGYRVYKKRKNSSSDTPVNKEQTTVLIHSDDSQKSIYKDQTPLPGYTPTDNIYVVEPFTSQSTNGSLPLPDITQGTIDVTQGTASPCLNNPKVIYAIIENIPMVRWREFVRRLGLSNHIIESTEQDYRHYRDAQYTMMQVWVTREGCHTSKRDQLFNVLREINLGGCIDKIEPYL